MNTLLLFASKHSRSFQHFSIKKNVKATFMTSKFADPKLDIVFKSLFGESDLLLDFINKALPTKRITSVQYIPTTIEPNRMEQKQSILDVLCTDENGSKYIVEMQSAKEKSFNKRALYDASKIYESQLKRGGQYSDLLEVIFIAITDFVMFPENKKYLSTSTIRDTETGEQTLKDLTFVFIEIPKYKVHHKDAKGIDEWIDLFKNAPNRNTIETSDPIIKRAYEKLKISNWTNQDLIYFEAYQKILLDNETRENRLKDESKAEGIAEGKAEGIAEGIAEGEAKLVKTMLRRNVDVDTIFKMTGISQDEIRRLGNDL